MAEKKASIVAEKKMSIKKSSVVKLEGDAASALGLTPEEAVAAKEAQDKLEIRALPVRQYLEASVVPLLLHGLQLLAIERYGYQSFFICPLVISVESVPGVLSRCIT